MSKPQSRKRPAHKIKPPLNRAFAAVKRPKKAKHEKPSKNETDDEDGKGFFTVELEPGAVVELEATILWSDFFPVLQVAKCFDLSAFVLLIDDQKVSVQSMDNAHISLLEFHIPICAFSNLFPRHLAGYQVHLCLPTLYKAARTVKNNNTTSLLTLQVVRSVHPVVQRSAFLYEGYRDHFKWCQSIPVYDNTGEERLDIPEDGQEGINSVLVSANLWKNMLYSYVSSTTVSSRDHTHIAICCDASSHSVTVRRKNSAATQRIQALNFAKHACNLTIANSFNASMLRPLVSVAAKITDSIRLELGEGRPLHTSFQTWSSDKIRQYARDTLPPCIINDLVKTILDFLAPANLAITFHHYIAPLADEAGEINNVDPL